MMYLIVLVLTLISRNEAQQHIKPKNQEQPQDNRPLLFYNGLQNAPLHYGVTLLEPQQHFLPRLQPQLLIYPNGAPPGQQFLLHPGAPPPGNFLLPQPQPGPEVLFRGEVPQNPVFVARYPKPTHIPPIEKDAEEIPTDPAKIPKFPNSRSKPEKLETFSDTKDDRISIDQEPSYATPEKLPPFFLKKSTKLKPGQRFFILNGQPLFTNYPQPLPIETPQELSRHSYPQNDFSSASVQDLLLRNQQQEESLQNYGQQQEAFLRNSEALPVFQQQYQKELDGVANEQMYGVNPQGYGVLHDAPESPLGYYQYAREPEQVDEDTDDTVVIDAKVQADDGKAKKAAKKPQAHSTTAAPSSSAEEEPSISQAQPAAVALAGPGGVAAAAPRGTALVGEGGLAVSSPQATAVAGPSKDKNGSAERPGNKKKE